MDEIKIAEMLAVAREVRARAYAPYSKFAVGAAVLGDDGRIYAGANVENASYGLSLCAERAALAAAVAGGARSVLAVVVVADPPPSPSGACREVIAELGPRAVVIWEDGRGGYVTRSVGDLLPERFRLRGRA